MTKTKEKQNKTTKPSTITVVYIHRGKKKKEIKKGMRKEMTSRACPNSVPKDSCDLGDLLSQSLPRSVLIYLLAAMDLIRLQCMRHSGRHSPSCSTPQALAAATHSLRLDPYCNVRLVLFPSHRWGAEAQGGKRVGGAPCTHFLVYGRGLSM